MVGNESLIDYYRETHGRRVYGTSSVKYVRFLRPWIRLLGPASVVDYGCGQSLLLDVLGLAPEVARRRYDPAIPAYATRPDAASDLLLNIDVLEHIEAKDIDGVIADMAALGRRALIIIDTKAAKHTLPDGRNAHVTLEGHGWWRHKLRRHFERVEPIAMPRRSRAGFKTWESGPIELLRYRMLRAREDAVHVGKWLSGKHNEHWKKSTTRDKAGTETD